MNKLLIVCSAIALIYGDSVFANTYGDDEKEFAESQKSPKGNNVWDFGTKDQWQTFFESQGEPQQLFFLSRKEADAIRKRKREKMDFLIKQLESLKTKDDITLLTDKLKELKIENEDKTGKLIDIDDEEELHYSKKIKNLDADRSDVKSESSRVSRNFSEEEEYLKPDASRKHRVRLKPLQIRNNAAQRKFAR